MTLERKYAALFVTLLSGVGLAVGLILHKYSWGITSLFLHQCSAYWTLLFRSGFHLVGTLIFGFSLTNVLLVSVVAVFAYLKTVLRRQVALRQVAPNWPAKLAKVVTEYQIQASSILFIEDDRPIAYSIGINVPRIVVSSGLMKVLNVRQLTAVLLHEYYHVQHFHPCYILYAELIKRAVFFLPILQDIVALMRYRFEVAADGFAETLQGTGKFVQEALQVVEPPRHHLGVAFAQPVGTSRIAPHWSRGTTRRLIVTLLTVMSVSILIWLPVRVEAAESTTPSSGGMSLIPRRCEALTAKPNLLMSRKQ